MSARLDSSTLDRVWDAHVLGAPLPSPVEDAGERALLALLDEFEQPEPNPIFAQALARALSHEATSTTQAPVSTVLGPQGRTPRTLIARSDPWSQPISRWMGAVSALAAIALLFVISTFPIIYQRSNEPDLSSIPAVGGGVTPGTADASGVEATSIGTYTLTVDDLEAYQSRNWHWIGLTRGTIAAGESPAIAQGSPIALDRGPAGFASITVEDGTLSASVDASAWIQRGQSGPSEQIASPTTVTLDIGDTLFAPSTALLALWNSGETDVAYLAGGVYSVGPTYPLDEDGVEQLQGGIQVDPNDLAIGESVRLALDHAVIGPGETYHYAISSETWLLAMVTGDGLQKQKRIDDEASGTPLAIAPGIYSLHPDGFGEYELTNAGSEPVDVYYFRVEPLPQMTMNTQVEVLVAISLSPEQLQGYRFDDWRWLQFNRNSVIPQGDSEQYGTLTGTAGWNPVPGMNLMVVESGVLIVAPETEVLVARGPSGELASEPGGSEITLQAGDALLYLTGTIGRFWNPTDVDTIVVGGGGYIRPDYPTFAEARGFIAKSGEFAHGTTVSAREMPDDHPVSFAIERVSITPDASVMINLDPGIWTLVTVERGDLLQTTYENGAQSGESIALRQGEVTLRFEEGKTVQLRNVGANAAVIYLMRVEPADSDDVF